MTRHEARGRRLLSIWLLSALCSVHGLMTYAQGIPFIRNLTAEEYHGHNRNFDILALDDGTVFVANFEGLLYFDNAEWQMLHTPDIANLTTLFRDHRGMVWAGGYNYIGHVAVSANGSLRLQRIGSGKEFDGEVQQISERNGYIEFTVSDGTVCQVAGTAIRCLRLPAPAGKGGDLNTAADSTSTDLGHGFTASIHQGRGLTITYQPSPTTHHPSPTTHHLSPTTYNITEANGLCSNNVTAISYNGHGVLWGATDVGLFTIALPSCYSRFTSHEGLVGEVLAITDFAGNKYAGTTTGLYRLEASRREFHKLPGIEFACWQLFPDGDYLLVATANGIYRVSPTGNVSQLTDVNCTMLFRDGATLYSGQSDGVWVNPLSAASRRRLCPLPYVNKIYKDGHGTLWIRNTYGRIFSKKAIDSTFCATDYQSHTGELTIVKLGSEVSVINAEDEQPVPYPLFSHADSLGVTWLTNREGRQLYCWQKGQRQRDWEPLLAPLQDLAVRAASCRHHELWIGHEHGITIVNARDHSLLASAQASAGRSKVSAAKAVPRIHLRTMRIGADSILWGGFSEVPTLDLPSDIHHLSFAYGVDFPTPVGTTLYRYRLNDNSWSAWTPDREVHFNGISFGSYHLSVEALLPTGELTNRAEISFTIAPPFFLRWYMQLLYVLLIAAGIYGIFRYRLHRLSVEKQKLETTVRQRTAEVVSQRDEILHQKEALQQQSQQLAQALHDLSAAQEELIRNEQMATVGKLTKGLVDRILNPLNYIINFSKLSGNLVRDLRQNIEDERSHIDGDTYDDTIDMLEMLGKNLQQVDEHGQNTARIVNAMGQILEKRHGNYEAIDLCGVLRQCEKTVAARYAADISRLSVALTVDIPSAPLPIKGNGDQLCKSLCAIIDNAFYAIARKLRHVTKAAASPYISVRAAGDGGQAVVTIANNGIGIEPQNMDKVFDPFFTTKPTAEASGIGLYICREVIQNHHGDITFSSNDEQTQFIITLPTTQAVTRLPKNVKATDA